LEIVIFWGGSRAITGRPQLAGGVAAGCGGSSRRLLATRHLPLPTWRATRFYPCRTLNSRTIPKISFLTYKPF